MGCSPPGSSVRGIVQAKILEGVAISFSEESSWSRDRTRVSCIAGRFFTNWAMGEAHPVSIRDHKECAAGIAENGYHSWSWPPQCCPTPDACLLAHTGTGCWNSGFRGQIWEENRGWRCRDSLKGLECGPAPTWDVSRMQPRSAIIAPLLMRCEGRGKALPWWPHSPLAHSFSSTNSRRRVRGDGAEISAISQRKWTSAHLLHQQLCKLSTCGTSAALFSH